MYRPASARTLAFCLKADAQRESLERYKADALWLLVKWFIGDHVNLKRYGDWLNEFNTPPDTQTKNEIFQSLIAKLKEKEA